MKILFKCLINTLILVMLFSIMGYIKNIDDNVISLKKQISDYQLIN